MLSMITSSGDKSCKHGNYEYSVANYSSEIFMKKKYQNLFNLLLNSPTYNCFCEQKISGLPGEGKKNKYSIVIEPFFVDLESSDGIYGYRMWSQDPKALNPRYLCGYYHHIFLLANKTYYSLSSDSIANVNLVKEKLSKTFTSIEIDRIIQWGIQNNCYCNNYTFDWPIIIKRDSAILWDIELESQENNK